MKNRFIPIIYTMEMTMAKERTDFIAKQSDKIALRAIDRNGLMVGREFDNFNAAIDMAKDYWIKGFLYVEAFCVENEKFVVHYHGVRNY